MERRINPEPIRRLVEATRDAIYEDSRLIVDDDPAGAWLHKTIQSLGDAAAYLLEVEAVDQVEREHLEQVLSDALDAFGMDKK